MITFSRAPVQLPFALAALALAGCSGGGTGTGVFGGPLPSGYIQVSAYSGASAVSATAFNVPGRGFSVSIREDNYPSGFSASIVSYTAPTTIPCWQVTVDQSHQPNIATFIPSIVIDPKTQLNVCPTLGDVEGVRFVDQRGNGALYTFTTTT